MMEALTATGLPTATIDGAVWGQLNVSHATTADALGRRVVGPIACDAAHARESHACRHARCSAPRGVVSIDRRFRTGHRAATAAPGHRTTAAVAHPQSVGATAGGA